MEDERTSDRRTQICVAGMLVGALVALAGFAWSALAEPSDVWTEQQAAEHQAAGEALHNARRGADTPEHSAALAAARERFDRIEAELDAARTGRHRTGKLLVQAGLAAMVLFGIGYLATRGG